MNPQSFYYTVLVQLLGFSSLLIQESHDVNCEDHLYLDSSTLELCDAESGSQIKYRRSFS